MKYIELEVSEKIGYITLNRPEKRNALNHDLIGELRIAFQAMSEDKQVKVIVLRARGDVFCAGADLSYLQQLQQYSYEENLKDSTELKDLLLQIYTLDKVVIAAVQGHAIAGGCGLISACDFIFTVPDASFGYTEVRIGFLPAIVMVFLLRRIRESSVKELLLGGNLITAPKALEMGLINRIVSADSLAVEVASFGMTLCTKNSGESMKVTKQMIAAVQSMSLEDSLRYAAEMNARARSSDDCKKGIAAFLNKERVIW
jgi:methylglutaconyl-CoA hydratase